MRVTLSLVSVIVLAAAAHATLLPFLQPPKHDGVKRVCHLSADNFTTVLSAAEIAIVLFHAPPQVVATKSACPTELDTFAEVTAQVLRKKNIIVCEASVENPTPQTDGTVQVIKPGDVYIYKKGLGVPYYGIRSPSALLSFLFKVNGTQVNIITGKIDKIAFDAVQEPKVVGFFMQGTADYKAFEDAAAALSPAVSFYVAFDRVVAKHLKLTTVGEIYLIRPFEKTPIPCPQNPATSSDIEAFISGYKGSVLSKITEHNLYDPQLMDPTRRLVLAIGEQSSSLGGYFHHLVKKLVCNNTNNTEFQKLNIVWIEPQIFPSVHLASVRAYSVILDDKHYLFYTFKLQVMDELEATLGIPNKLPAIGTVNVTTMESAWLNTALINATADKTADEQNIRVLEDWLSGVINNTVIPIKIGAQAFVQVPTSQVLLEGSDIILECVIENAVGDCLWLRDNRNIGFNLARYPQYSWRGDTATGDCSLKITGVQRGRDDGQWVCEVTGDQNNPTITSPPATVIIAVVPAPADQTAKTEL